MWYPEPSAFLPHVLVSDWVFIMSPAWWHESTNAEAAHNCAGLVCCFHLPYNPHQLNPSSDFLVLFWQRGNAFKPNTRAALSAFGWVQKLPSYFLQGHLTWFLCYSSHMPHSPPQISVAHLTCKIILCLKLQEVTVNGNEWLSGNQAFYDSGCLVHLLLYLVHLFHEDEERTSLSQWNIHIWDQGFHCSNTPVPNHTQEFHKAGAGSELAQKAKLILAAFTNTHPSFVF